MVARPAAIATSAKIAFKGFPPVFVCQSFPGILPLPRHYRRKCGPLAQGYPILGYSKTGFTFTNVRRELRSKRYEKLRNLLAQARTDCGMTQADLAGVLKRPQSFVSKYEGGERRLDVIEYLDICRAIGVSASSLLSQLE
jgi:DNA-binding XRE family transcriptional regulator